MNKKLFDIKSSKSNYKLKNDLIMSISFSQTEIINNILKLHVKNHIIDCDCTYSLGKFYDSTGIHKPKYKFDINPQLPEVIQADSRNLPLEDNSIECMMFDPPFLATTGKSLKSNSNNNAINRRFGVYDSEQELHKFYKDSLKEAYRVLNPDGILIFKCQDKISGGKQYMSHCFIYNEAINIGFYCKDLFILLAKSRLVANWQLQNQQNARKFHSYFYVFEKSDKKIDFI